MRMRLEIDVKSRAASLDARRFQSENFSVLHSVVSVRSASNHVALSICNHGADVGIGRGQTDAPACEFKRAPEKLSVYIE
jgi:hypothetical protein